MSEKGKEKIVENDGAMVLCVVCVCVYVCVCVHVVSTHLDLCMEALQLKVFPGTEASTFNDSFFQAQDMVVNALDNVEARRYVDRLISPHPLV